MAYKAYTWRDDPTGRTPIEALRMNALEQGLATASKNAEDAVAVTRTLGTNINATAFLSNSAAKTMRSGIWEAYITMAASSNPNNMVRIEGTNGYLRPSAAGIYLIGATMNLASAPSGPAQLTIYSAPNSAPSASQRAETARFHGTGNGLISGVTVLSMTTSTYLSFGVRDANGANTLNAGALRVSVTKLV